MELTIINPSIETYIKRSFSYYSPKKTPPLEDFHFIKLTASEAVIEFLDRKEDEIYKIILTLKPQKDFPGIIKAQVSPFSYKARDIEFLTLLFFDKKYSKNLIAKDKTYTEKTWKKERNFGDWESKLVNEFTHFKITYLYGDNDFDLRKRNYQIEKVEFGKNFDIHSEVKDLHGNQIFTQSFEHKQDKMLKAKCSCNKVSNNFLCIHMTAVLTQLFDKHGSNFFGLAQDLEKKKENLLREYGYSLSSPDIESRFSITYEHDGLHVTPLDNTRKKIYSDDFFSEYDFSKKQIFESPALKNTQKRPEKELGVILVKNFREPFLEIRPIYFTRSASGKLKMSLQSMNELGQSYNKEVQEMTLENFELFKLLLTASKSRLDDRFHKLYPESYGNIFTSDSKHSAQAADILYPAYNRIWGLSKTVTFFYSDSLSKSMDIAICSPLKLKFRFFETTKKELTFEMGIFSDETIIDINQEVEITNTGILSGNKFYPISDFKTRQGLMFGLKYQGIVIETKQKQLFYKKLVLPLIKNFEAELPPSLKVRERKDAETPSTKIYLGEEGDFLKLTPMFVYADVEINSEENIEFIIGENEKGELYKIRRNTDYEREMIEFIAASNPNLERNYENFFLPTDEVLENNWFLEAFEVFRERGIEILGYGNLQKFRYNTNKPKTEFRISSNIDWFDLKITVTFGSQLVQLKDIRKALLNNQHYVKLGDGTLGILPQEWLEKYSSLFKMGETEKQSLHVSKVHFALLENIEAEIDSETVLKELEEKRNKLLLFEEIKEIKLPKNVKAELRNYQEKGYQWLNFLDEYSWGGCLADDMGLGKTLQMLTFLKKQAELKPEETNLVILPTSLVFNWCKEIEKFVPDLTFYVHYGANRCENIEEVFPKYNLVLTTYGIALNDCDLFSKFTFNYIILDEAQAIKNISTQRYKAVMLLNAKNRFTMTGTPVENNTSELYAQMNFLNPGCLGSYEFFKTEFANPIDRNSDKMKVQELKKIIYPFILRRTKEQVANDLPEKTETVLYCEMNNKQRNVYEGFKNYYRELILEKIESDGIAGAGMFILEGLLKLRQICDSPALLNEKEKYDEDSIKLETLTEHLLKITEKHKVLVFSQFLGMLDLVKKRLVAHKIPFVYLDGKTNNRAELVSNFQEDESNRVFLISLKAGGVGLNLTAAQYVFLIDPWWNPAVENQAIDRTHRIGQSEKVFAYKMICKDSIEEKILTLQEKKKDLADDIISTETSIMKKLTKDDVKALFS